MSTNLEYRAAERQRKRESRRQASEAKREKGDRGLERQMRHFFVVRTAGKFCSGKFFAEIYRLNTQIVENLFAEKVHPAVLV